MNRADKQAAYVIGDYNKHTRAEEKLRNKAEKIIGKSTGKDGVARVSKRNTNKLTKMAEKAQEHLKGAEDAKKRLKDIESYQYKLMGEAANQGYSVTIKKQNRSTVRNGEQFLNAFLFGGIGAGIKEVRDYGAKGTVTEGNRFRVSRH